MKPTLLAALLLVPPALRAAAEPPRKISVMMDEADSADRDLYRGIADAYRSRERVSSFELKAADRNDPIAKGRVLSVLQASDLVVTVGDGATGFATAELEDVPVYFVNASVVPGKKLADPDVSGLFGYSVDDMLDALKALRLTAVGLVFTPGYEHVADWIRQGAASRGLAFAARRVETRRELPTAVRFLMGKSKAVWLVGDPLLVEGAAYDFIEELSLSEKVPLVGRGLATVENGALLGSAPDRGQQQAIAVRDIDSILREGRARSPRLAAAARGGVILINGPLAAKWKLKAPEAARWRRVR